MLNFGKEVELLQDIPECNLKRGDVGILVGYAPPSVIDKETIVILEIKGKETPIFRAAVPMSALDLD